MSSRKSPWFIVGTLLVGACIVLLGVWICTRCEGQNTRALVWLGSVEPLAVSEGPRSLEDGPRPDYEAWVAAGQDIPRIETYLRGVLETHPDREMREMAAYALGRLCGTESIQSLLRALDDEDARVRWQAALSLGRVEADVAVPRLSRILILDGDVNVRICTAIALGRIGNPTALSSLKEALGDENSMVREEAEKSIRELKGSDVMAPMQTQEDPTEENPGPNGPVFRPRHAP